MHLSTLFSSVVLAIAATTIAAPIPWANENKGSDVEAGGGGQAQGGDVNGGYKGSGCDECDHEHGGHGGVLGSLLGGALLNVASDNGGDGGSADGGNALLGGHGVGNGAHAVKGGPGGNAKGGDVNGPGGLLNIISNNAGDGGHANGGDAVLLGGLLGGKQRGDWGDKHDGPWGDRHDDGPNHD